MVDMKSPAINDNIFIPKTESPKQVTKEVPTQVKETPKTNTYNFEEDLDNIFDSPKKDTLVKETPKVVKEIPKEVPTQVKETPKTNTYNFEEDLDNIFGATTEPPKEVKTTQVKETPTQVKETPTQSKTNTYNFDEDMENIFGTTEPPKEDKTTQVKETTPKVTIPQTNQSNNAFDEDLDNIFDKDVKATTLSKKPLVEDEFDNIFN